MLTLSFNILNSVYLWTKAMKKLISNFIEEDFSQRWKIYPSTHLRRRKSNGRDSRCFALEKMSNSFDKYDNNYTCTRPSWRASLLFAVFFKGQRKKYRIKRLRAWKFKRRSQLKTRMNWQKFERFSPKKLTTESFDNDNKFIYIYICIRTNGGKMETTSRQTQCSCSKILQS